MKSLRCLAAVFALGAGLNSALAADPVAKPEEKPKWVSSAGLNFALTEGNSQTLLVGVSLDSIKKAAENEYLVGASLAYGKNDGDKNVETYRAYGQWNHLFSERWYGYLRGEGLHDGIADVNYRFTITAGAGYYIIKDERCTFAVEAGPGYVFERLDGDDESYPTIRLAERYERKIGKNARVWQSAEFLPSLEDFDKYIINAELGVEAALTQSLSLRSVVTDTYNSEPAPGRKKNDVKLITGINYKF